MSSPPVSSPASPVSNFPETFTIGQSGGIEKLDYRAYYDGDPRGILWVWELPRKSATYFMGVDPTSGITGWNRFSRCKEDRKVNNGAIEILRQGNPGQPDIQVAEFASPNDPFELGYYANIMGRLYSGMEDDQCVCILETYPGPGGMTLRQMVECGYVNFWKWQYYAEATPGQTQTIGWTASQKSNRDLWTKASAHLVRKGLIIRSQHLAEEYANCRYNVEKQYAENPNNNKGHGDRRRAMDLAIWAANGWSLDFERTMEPVNTGPVVDWQATDMSWEQIMEGWNNAVDRMEKR